MDDHSTSARARGLDAADPLAAHRDRFVGAETDLVYFDGNSLGRPLRDHGPDAGATSSSGEWGGRLIRGWDEAWFDLPLTVGDDLGRVVLGAAPGQVTIGDSTTVLLYKAMRAAVAARPGRTEIVLDRDNFPTDRYVAAGIAQECGLTLRWIDVDTGVRGDGRAGGRGRGGADRAGRAQPRGLPLGLAGGRPGDHRARPRRRARWCCGTSPTRAGPSRWSWTRGAPTWRSAAPTSTSTAGPARRRTSTSRSGTSTTFTQPIQGWIGATDPFLMGPTYAPAAGRAPVPVGHAAGPRHAAAARHARAGRGGRDRARSVRSRSG